MALSLLSSYSLLTKQLKQNLIFRKQSNETPPKIQNSKNISNNRITDMAKNRKYAFEQSLR
jgi:hypothetical protein